MEFENQIQKYPKCQNCPLVAQSQEELEADSEYSDQQVILTQCHPKLSILWGHYAVQIGLVTDIGRLEKLQKLNPNNDFIVSAPAILIKQNGNCEPLIKETGQKATHTILKFLHLE